MHRKLNAILRGGLIAALLGTAACTDAHLAASAATPAASFETEAIPSVNVRSMMDTITRGMIADSTDDYDPPSTTAVSRFRQVPRARSFANPQSRPRECNPALS